MSVKRSPANGFCRVRAGDGSRGRLSFCLRGSRQGVPRYVVATLVVLLAFGVGIASSATTTSPAPRSLTLSKADSPDPAQVGRPLTYNLSVGNPLSTRVEGVTLTDTLPRGVSFTSAIASQGTCSHKSGVVTCKLGRLDSGREASVTIQVSPTSAGIITNSATVTGKGVPDPATATAETTVSAAACGTVITQSTKLASDIGPCARDGVIVGADGITLDLAGKRVFGFPGPADGNAAGIRLPMRTGVTVTSSSEGGAVSDFDSGVVVMGGGSNTVSKLRVQDNIGPDDGNAFLGDGIYILNSAANRILNNVVSRNGRYDGIGIWGDLANANTIQDNVVEDTVGPSHLGPAGQGIIIIALTGRDTTRVVFNTIVTGNTIRGNAAAGIGNVNHVDGSIVGNIVEGNGVTNHGGQGIVVQSTPQGPVATRHLIQDNHVFGNALDGIFVGTTENQILRNNAPGNVVRAPHSSPSPTVVLPDDPKRIDLLQFIRGTQVAGSFDLHDLRSDCAGNAWIGNIWGAGGYSSDCVTVGGQGPLP